LFQRRHAYVQIFQIEGHYPSTFHREDIELFKPTGEKNHLISVTATAWQAEAKDKYGRLNEVLDAVRACTPLRTCKSIPTLTTFIGNRQYWTLGYKGSPPKAR
jgi:hypothetical protein